ncbi:MAG: Maf family nucleotide pyrophosphatase [Nanoarchaeota archaeon]
MRIILASESAARKHGMDVLGVPYEVMPASLDEKAIRDPDPHAMAQKLAVAKAKAISEKERDAIVIAADLFVVHDEKIIEKPLDVAEAKRMLRTLSGATHEMVSGLAVYDPKKKKMHATSITCKVTFRTLTDHEIDDYVTNHHVTRYAAGFEHDGLLRFATHIEGGYIFRTGMPIDHLILFLRECGVKV